MYNFRTILDPLNNLKKIIRYDEQDMNSVYSQSSRRKFGIEGDYVETFIYDLSNNLLSKIRDNQNIIRKFDNPDINYTDDIIIQPEEDLNGFPAGKYNLIYNFFRPKLTLPLNKFIIKDISSDRTELKIQNLNVSSNALKSVLDAYIIERENSNYFKDFLLNFDNNLLIVGVNISYDPTVIENPFSFYVKLYKPLPENININKEFSIVEEISESILFENIEISQTFFNNNYTQLRGPNFDIDNFSSPNSTEYLNYDDIISSNNQTILQLLQSKLNFNNITPSIDYSDYNNFIHFSSAKERLLNFLYKLKLIESYKFELSNLNFITGPTSGSLSISTNIELVENKINNIINGFDGYEKYLYFDSSSKSYPKSSTTLPYTLYSVTSSQTLTWVGSDNYDDQYYGGQLYSASYYDTNLNPSNLLNTIPPYIREDKVNEGYELFVSMIGHYYDYIWTYYKSVTDLYKAESSLTSGISKDLVFYALKSLGINVYQNDINIWNYFTGTDNSGSFQSYQTSSQETLIYENAESLPRESVTKEIWKRIYHNVPYLLKTKGTERGLRALINCYGIPSTVLRIKEFGGPEIENKESFYEVDKFTYALELTGGELNAYNTSSFISTASLATIMIPWESLNKLNSPVPDSIELRFKTRGIPPSGYYSQSLFSVQPSGSSNIQFGVQITYNNNSYYPTQGNLKLIISGTQGFTSSIISSAPIFNNDWWSLLISRDQTLAYNNTGSNVVYSIYLKNSLDTSAFFEYSSSIAITGSTSSSYNLSWNETSSLSTLYLGGYDNNNVITPNNIRFQGYFQEFRYWNKSLDETSFDYHVISAESIQKQNPTSSYTDLAYRLPLGTNLKNYNLFLTSSLPSYHPNQNIYPFTNSNRSSSFVGFRTINTSSKTNSHFISDELKYEINYPSIGFNRTVSNKIRIEPQNEIEDNILSPHVKVGTNNFDEHPIDSSKLGIYFSPQDEINEDIASQLGGFRIDDYIGDPNDSELTTYKDLNNLKEFYFQKYTSGFKYYDYIKLFKYFDQTLFQLIEQFTPGRTNPITGVLIQPHILERSKINLSNKPEVSNLQYSQSLDVNSYRTLNIERHNNYNIDIDIYEDYLMANSFSLFLQPNYTSSINISFNSIDYTNVTSSYNTNSNSIFYIGRFNITDNGVKNIKTRSSLNLRNSEYILSGSYIIANTGSNFSEFREGTYNLNSWSRSRYEGVKLTTYEINEWTDGDIGLNKEPNVKKYSRYILYFESIQDTSRIIKGSSTLFIKYLIDEFGNKITLDGRSNRNLEFLQRLFKNNEIATLYIIDSQNNSVSSLSNQNFNIIETGVNYVNVLKPFSDDDNILSNYITLKGKEVVVPRRIWGN